MNVNYENHFKKLAIVGNPVNHSLSPRMQNYILQKLNLEYSYLAVNLSIDFIGEKFSDFLRSAEILGFTGFNVTMPFKGAAYENCDEVFGDAKVSKSVNTLKFSDNKWFGYSTDGDGFTLALAEHNIFFEGKKVLLLGAGGSCRAVFISAEKNNAESITILGRNIEKCDDIIRLGENKSKTKTDLFNDSNLKKYFNESDIIINCTPLGMHGNDNNFLNFDFLQSNDKKILCDLIYNPLETLLLQKGGEHGHFTMNGLSMLFYQGFLACEIFTGAEISDKIGLKNELEKYILAD